MDKQIHDMLLKEIPYFHKLYAKYKDPQALEIAKNLGKAVENITKKV